MKIYRYLLQVVSLVFAVFSCNYTTDDEVFTEVKQPSLAGISINLNNHTEPVIVLLNKTNFTYSVSTGGKPLIESRVLLNDQTVWVTSFATGEFSLDPATLQTGDYKLKIIFTAKPESGSLADKLGAEVVFAFREYTVRVNHDVPDDPSDPNAIKITSVTVKDHSIFVTWQRYNNFNFQQYQIIREYKSEQGYDIQEAIFGSGVAEITEGFDHTYYGGAVKYRVKLYADNKEYLSPPFDYEHPYKPEITTKLEADGQVTISWNSLEALKTNFRSYKIDVWEYVHGFRKITSFSFTNLKDTSVTYMPESFRFGNIKNIRLYMKPDAVFTTHAYKAEMRIGKTFPKFDYPLNYNPDDNGFYFQRRGRFFKSDVHQAVVLDSTTADFEYFMTANKTEAFGTNNGKIYRIKFSTMEPEQMPNLPEGRVVAASDNGRVLIGGPDFGFKAFALNGNALSDGLFTSADTRFMKLSPDGKYMLRDPHVFVFNETTYETLYNYGWHTYGFNSAEFIDNARILRGSHNSILIHNLETNVTKSTSVYHGPCNYDPVSNKIGCLNDDKFLILDPDNFNLIKSLDVDPGFYQLINNSVICSSGSQISLEDIP